jgi:hypothetical protein
LLISVGDPFCKLHTCLAAHGLRTEQVSRHALNRGQVDEGMAQLWRGEILVWQNLWIKRGIVSEIFALKTLGVHFVLLCELVSFWGIESVKLANCLCRERFAVYQEEDFSDQL